MLPNGKVLVAGGLGNSGDLTSAELYDPASGTWTATGSLTTARGAHTATLLPNGKVLVAGGLGNFVVLTQRGTVRPGHAGRGLPPAASTHGRFNHTATLLPNGKVLVAGGLGTSGFLTQRGTVRPCQRDVDCHWQPQHRTP